jgi:LuxR family maltose regulon positive regulatory protein
MRGRRATKPAIVPAKISVPRRVEVRRKVVPAKISVPRLDATYQRPRVFRTLDTARRQKVVWISAPPGAGKTSTAAAYLTARRFPALWYNVDARDADAANVFSYLSLAARNAQPRRKLDLPTFSAENQLGVPAFAASFFEALYRQRPSPSAIVLDDYHEARSELFDAVVREAIGALPKGVSIVVLSRADPPRLLVRQVASGDIALVGVDTLRLTPRDVAGLVRVCRPDLRGAPLKKVLPRIIELANGWAAALTLLLREPNLAGFDPIAVGQFSERLFDYFAVEILDKATASQRDFLLRTAVVATFTPSLAAHLADVPDARPILTELDRRSFLLQRLGDSGAYRYHPLFRSVLLRRAEADLGRAALRDLHRRAAQMLVQNGLVEEAMEQLHLAQDVLECTKVVLRLAPVYAATGRSRTIARWIAQLPAEWIARNGWLLYWQAVSAFGHWETHPTLLLERAYVLFARDKIPEGLYLTCAAATQAIVQDGTDYGRLDAWIARFEALDEDGPPCPEPFLPMAATGMMLASAFRRPDAAHNRKWVERAMELVTQSQDLGHRVLTVGFLAMYFALYESPAMSARILELFRGSARDSASSSLLAITIGQAKALCSWLQGENEASIEHVREAVAISARTGVFAGTNFLYGLGLCAALSLEDAMTAREFLEALAAIAERRGGWPAGNCHINACWDALTRGDVPRALHCAQLGSASAEREGPPFGQKVAQLLLAQALWQAGRSAEAHAALDLAKLRAEEAAAANMICGCLLVESDLTWSDDRRRSIACLRQAFTLARERGYLNMFALGKSVLVRATLRALQHDIEADHVRECIRKNRLRPDNVPIRLEAWPWRHRFRVFGAFDMVLDGSRAPIRGTNDVSGGLRGMPLRLLQAILVFGASGVRDVRIIDALWPDAEGDAGRRVFDTTLHRLRRQLGPIDLLRLSDGRLSVDKRDCWVDIWAFDDLVDEVKRQTECGVTVEVLANLARELLGIYRGRLLEDDEAGTPWAQIARARFSSQFRRTAHPLSRVLEQAGEGGLAKALDARSGEDRFPHPSVGQRFES